jgi:hypothetical protein
MLDGPGVVKRLRQGYGRAGMLGVAQQQCNKGSPQTRVTAASQPKDEWLGRRSWPFVIYCSTMSSTQVEDPGVVHAIDQIVAYLCFVVRYIGPHTPALVLAPTALTT